MGGSTRGRTVALWLLGAVATMVLLEWTGLTDIRVFDRQPEAAAPDSSAVAEQPDAVPADSSPESQLTPSSTPPPEPPPSPLPETEPSSEPEAEPEPSNVAYFLSDLAPVHVELEGRGSCTGGCTGFDEGSERIGGAPFPRSYVMRMDSDGGRSISTWNALGACETFAATVGLTDDSDTTSATFAITLDDGSEQVLAQVETNDSLAVAVPLDGVDRFTLSAYVTGAEPDRAIAVWGDANLTCLAGSLDDD